jgi:hypothetical protein
MDTIWKYFNTPNQDPSLFLARLLRSKDESFATEILRGLSNYNHSMAFNTGLDFTNKGKKRHRKLQMKYFKIALDFCWLLKINPPKPSWKVLRAFPDLRLLSTKEGRLTYAFREKAEKSKLIRKLLDYEYTIPADASREDRENMDIERQILASRMGWPDMTIEKLENQVAALYPK